MILGNLKRQLKIKQAQRGIDTDAEFARRIGWSPSNYSNKLQRGDFRMSDLEKMADVLGCDLLIELTDKNEDE